VLSYNRVEDLARTIPRIAGEIENGRAELIIVDNASSDGSGEFLDAFSRECGRAVRVVRNGGNLGVAAGRNVGYRAARGKYIINLDDDTYIFPGLVTGTIEAFERSPEVGIIVFRVRHHATKADQNPHGEFGCEVANFHGAGHAFRRAVFDRVGYLDERCAFGGEELEMSIRSRLGGFGVRYFPDLMVEHNSIRRTERIEIERRAQWRYNYTRILFKYFPESTARLFSWRLLVPDLVYGLGVGLRSLSLLWREFLRGRTEGREEYTPLYGALLAFYRNPALLPDLGNVPLTTKLHHRVRSTVKRMISR
jgi:GT2 family glycosyltransferase